MKKLLAMHSGGNGEVRVMAEECPHSWRAYTEYDHILIIRDTEDKVIYGDTIQELIDRIKAVYPEWHKIFRWL